MRWFATICFVFLCLPVSWAQHQEPNLVDRLLRPNMELQNNSQGKKFVANSAVIKGRGTVGTFFLKPTLREKSFQDTREVNSARYPSRPFHHDHALAASLQGQNVKTPANISTTSLQGIHDTHDARKSIASTSYSDEHPFRDQGKSQKSLNRQNPPLTIEQVRELLNKNK